MSYKPNTCLHTKTFTNFSFLLNSKKLIRLQERKPRFGNPPPLATTTTYKPTISLPHRDFDYNNDLLLSEESSPKQKFKEIKNKGEIEFKQQSIHQRVLKVRNSCSPMTLYGMGENRTSLVTKASKLSKTMIPKELLHLNLANINTPQHRKKVHSTKTSVVNIDSMANFEKQAEKEENDTSRSQTQVTPAAKDTKSSSSSEEHSAYIDSSWRDIRKSMKMKEKALKLRGQEEQEKKTHEEIIKILRQINHSDVLMFDGLTDKNVRPIHEISRNQNPTAQLKTINEIISPNKRLLKDPFTYTVIESKANRFNIKNKRITLQGMITRSEWEKEKEEAFPTIDGKQTMGEVKKRRNKREFYSKWYLPVDYWKIPKPMRKKNLLDTPLKYDDTHFYKHLHDDLIQNENPFVKKQPDAHKTRLELFQEKLKKNFFVAKYKEILLRENVRVPVFLEKVPL